MTRLEDIERLIAKFEEFNKTPNGPTGTPNFDTYQVDRASLLYAIDCYRARVAVLEEALALVADRDCLCSEYIDSDPEEKKCLTCLTSDALTLTPEECLERQKGVG